VAAQWVLDSVRMLWQACSAHWVVHGRRCGQPKGGAPLCKQEPGVGMLFIESICTDQTILQHNYSMKLQNEDYRDRDRKDALKDFMVCGAHKWQHRTG